MQIENHEGTLVHFLQGKRQRIPGRLAPYLGATADRVASGLFEAPAFAFGNDRIGKGTSLAGPKALKKAAKLEFKVNLTPFIAISIPEKVFEVAMSGSW